MSYSLRFPHIIGTPLIFTFFAEDVRYIPGPLPVSEVIYFQTNVDSTGATLDASTGNNYTITFQLPIPAKYFWSLIIYNATSLNLIDNPINRYSVSDRVGSSPLMRSALASSIYCSFRVYDGLMLWNLHL